MEIDILLCVLAFICICILEIAAVLEPLCRVIEPLDLAQGGFRRHSETIETVASLNESILQFQQRRHRKPILLFLDIKAA